MLTRYRSLVLETRPGSCIQEAVPAAFSICNTAPFPLADSRDTAGTLPRYWFYNSVPNPCKKPHITFHPGFTPLECVVKAIKKYIYMYLKCENPRYNNLKATFIISIIKYFMMSKVVKSQSIRRSVSEYFNLHTDGSGICLSSCVRRFTLPTTEKKTTQKPRPHSYLQCF